MPYCSNSREGEGKPVCSEWLEGIQDFRFGGGDWSVSFWRSCIMAGLNFRAESSRLVGFKGSGCDLGFCLRGIWEHSLQIAPEVWSLRVQIWGLGFKGLRVCTFQVLPAWGNMPASSVGLPASDNTSPETVTCDEKSRTTILKWVGYTCGHKNILKIF